MRCPNCGNENPPDYLFCDECGARLNSLENPGGEQAQAEGAASRAEQVPEPAGVAASPAPAESTAMASETVSPAAEASPDAPPAAEPVEATAEEKPVQPYEGEMAGNVSSAPEASAAGAGLDVPLTEDTMAAEGSAQPAPGQVEAPLEAAPEVSLPGVTPVAETAPAAEPVLAAEAQQPEAPVQAPAPWAEDALRRFDEGQQALSRGDWAAFGQAMSVVRNLLAGAAQGQSPAAGSPESAPAGMMAAEQAQPYGQAAPEPPMPGYPVQPASEPPQQMAPMPMPIPPQAQVAAPSASAGVALARLVIISTGAELPLPDQEEITIGREDPSSGIFPDVDLTPYGGEEGGVSRRHARLLHIDEEYFVEDLQSTNFTKLDGQRLPAHVRERLEDGARIDFGRVAVIFRRS